MKQKIRLGRWVSMLFTMYLYISLCLHLYAFNKYSKRNPLTHEICLGESSVIEDGFDSDGSALKWAGGGGGGGGATYIYRVRFFIFFLFSSLKHIFKNIHHSLVSPLKGAPCRRQSSPDSACLDKPF